jgi:hypothetical protein
LKSNLESTRLSIENSWEEWNSLLKKISKDTERAEEVNTFKAFSNKNLLKDKLTDSANLIFTLNKNLNLLKKQHKILLSALSAASTTPVLTVATSKISQAKLPKLEHPKFSGDKLCWPEF